MENDVFPTHVAGEPNDAFSALRAEYKRFQEAINEARASKQRLIEQVKQYEVERVKLFRNILEARGELWCAQCDQSIPRAETRSIFVRMNENTSEGYETEHVACSWIAYACNSCWSRIEHHPRNAFPHHFLTEYRTVSVFIVREQDMLYDNHYRRIENIPVPKETNDRRWPAHLSLKMTAKFSLPPRTEFVARGQDSVSQTNPAITYYAGGYPSDMLLVGKYFLELDL